MTVEKFLQPRIESDKHNVKYIGEIPNKRLAKIFKRYNNINVLKYTFDNPNKPDKITHMDTSGTRYVSYWFPNFKYNKTMYKEAKSRAIRYALKGHKKEPVWKETFIGCVIYYFQIKNDIVTIRLDNWLKREDRNVRFCKNDEALK